MFLKKCHNFILNEFQTLSDIYLKDTYAAHLPWLSLWQVSRVYQHAPNELFCELPKEKVN